MEFLETMEVWFRGKANPISQNQEKILQQLVESKTNNIQNESLESVPRYTPIAVFVEDVTQIVPRMIEAILDFEQSLVVILNDEYREMFHLAKWFDDSTPIIAMLV